jgi:hypothetical protein
VSGHPIAITPVALSKDIVNLEHQLDPGRRQPGGANIWNYPPGGSDTHVVPLKRDIRVRLAALIGGEAEMQDTRVEVNDDVKIVRENLEPQCHPHHWMVT